MHAFVAVMGFALLFAGTRPGGDPRDPKSACAARRRMPATPTGSATTACRPAAGRTANPGGVRAVAVPATYAGMRRAAAEGADDAGLGARRRLRTGTSRSTSTSRSPTTPGAGRRLPAARLHARLLRRQQDELGGDELRRRRREVALQQRLVRLARLRRHHLHGARVRRRQTTRARPARRSSTRAATRSTTSSTSRARSPTTRSSTSTRSKVVVTGGSYGGGFSWLALTDPVWKSPGGTDMKLAAAAPKYGWTDLVDSLVPTGRHSSSRRATLPGLRRLATRPRRSACRSAADRRRRSTHPARRGSRPAARTRPSRPDRRGDRLPDSADPFETNPLCTDARSTTRCPSSSAIARPTTRTTSSRKMRDRSRATAMPGLQRRHVHRPAVPARRAPADGQPAARGRPGYPIQQYYGDYQHFVQNKAKEWGDICGDDRHVCASADYAGGDVERHARLARAHRRRRRA